MSLVSIHRLLIGTFIACALIFAALMARRGGAAGHAAAACALAAAATFAVYLARARHLRRK